MGNNKGLLPWAADLRRVAVLSLFGDMYTVCVSIFFRSHLLQHIIYSWFTDHLNTTNYKIYFFLKNFLTGRFFLLRQIRETRPCANAAVIILADYTANNQYRGMPHIHNVRTRNFLRVCIITHNRPFLSLSRSPPEPGDPNARVS